MVTFFDIADITNENVIRTLLWCQLAKHLMGMPLATADLQMKLMETTAKNIWTNKCQLLILMETGKQTVK